MFNAITQIMLATAISSAPLARAEVEVEPDSAHVLAYDTEGEVAAEIVVWHYGEEIRLDALFPDGTSLNATILGGTVTVDSDDLEAARTQIVAVRNLLHDIDPQKGWLKCAAYAAISIEELAHASPIGVATAVLAACECLPLIIDEWEGMEC
jgi:hypothetical protein